MLVVLTQLRVAIEMSCIKNTFWGLARKSTATPLPLKKVIAKRSLAASHSHRCFGVALRKLDNRITPAREDQVRRTVSHSF